MVRFVGLLAEVASTTGIILDPVYTVKAVKGMLEEMTLHPERFKGRRVLYVHTGMSKLPVGCVWMCGVEQGLR